MKKEIKIRAEKISYYPIWRIYENGEERSFYDRKTKAYDGLTKKEVEDKVFNN